MPPSVPDHAEPSALLEHRGTRAVQRMVEFAPSTGGLALWVHHADQASEDDGAPCSTDGNTVFYTAAFEKLALPAQAGWVAHEVLHIALRHPQRYLELQQVLGDVDLQLFNICADAIVNSAIGHLGWLSLPAGAVQLERLLSTTLATELTAEAALLEWDVERLYRAIDDRKPSRSAGRQGGRGPQEKDPRSGTQPQERREDGPKSSRVRSLGAHSPADLRPTHGAGGAPEDEAEQAREWNQRLLRAHAGDGAHSMLRTLLADLPRSHTPWEQVLRTQLARGLSTRPTLSWSRPSRSYLANQGRCGPTRRMPWEPGISPTRPVPRLVVVVDVSGSVDDELMARFAGEVESIIRRLEAGGVLVIGDDRVQRVQAFEAGSTGLRDIEFNGRGGTDFTPLLEEADRHRPDIGVVLTDLDGPARFKPRWPVIWAVPRANASAVAPFGRLLVLR